MAGNSFGTIFRVTTFGESHGVGLGCVVDGVPAGLDLTIEDIQKELNRRRPGQSDITTSRKEGDVVEILSGIFEEKTLGTPIAMLIRNADQLSKDYDHLKDVFRPGHADQTFLMKFGIRDHRGGGRSSGRETSARVAAGAIAKKILAQMGVKIISYSLEIGGIRAETIDYDVIEKNPARAPDLKTAEFMIKKIHEAKQNEDSLGGIIETIILNLPEGLGDPVFDKLDAKISHALMSIGAVKGIEFDIGFKTASLTGIEHNKLDSGIAGGISNGKPITFRLAVKPTPSIAAKQQVLKKDLTTTHIAIQGRHDPCLCPRMVVVVEAMTAITLVDALLIQKTIR